MLDKLRRRLGSAAARGFFEGAARLGSLHPLANPKRHSVEKISNLRYLDGDREEHLLDVWRPLPTRAPFRKYSGPPWPIVFYVHGGAFRILSKDTHWVMALTFARRGFLVFNISYRLAPQFRFPTAVDDVCRAFAWAMKRAEEFGGDTSRVVLAGESAGANLVTSLAITLAYQRPEEFARIAWDTGIAPRAVVPACGVFQVSDIARLKRRKPNMPQIIADRLAEVEDGYLPVDRSNLDLADPLTLFERGDKPDRPLPPFFLPVGTRDPLLPDTREMASALRKLGVVAEDRYYEGELHAFHAMVMREQARRCWTDTFAFLDRYVP